MREAAEPRHRIVSENFSRGDRPNESGPVSLSGFSAEAAGFEPTTSSSPTRARLRRPFLRIGYPLSALATVCPAVVGCCQLLGSSLPACCSHVTGTGGPPVIDGLGADMYRVRSESSLRVQVLRRGRKRGIPTRAKRRYDRALSR